VELAFQFSGLDPTSTPLLKLQMITGTTRHVFMPVELRQNQALRTAGSIYFRHTTPLYEVRW
jgi:hypothetical protein